MIYYFSPFDTDKRLGRAHNECCRIVPNDDDWIVLMDGDIMFLRPDWGKQIADVIAKHGGEYAVLGCLANRLAGQHQQYKGRFSDEPDIRQHMAIATLAHAEHYDDVMSTDKAIAGMFMAFQKRAWIAAGGFPDNSIRFDVEFCDKVRRQGGRLGIMHGLYVFHMYRFGCPLPAYETKHLV